MDKFHQKLVDYFLLLYQPKVRFTHKMGNFHSKKYTY